jgi:ankyrin repeat protein
LLFILRQAWEKCSDLTKQQAMTEYIKLYNKLNGIEDEDIIIGFDSNLDMNFGDIDIPKDYEGSHSYSSNAKQSQKEIIDYLEKASNYEILFYSLREKFYNGDKIDKDFLHNYGEVKKFDCNFKIFYSLVLNSRDPSGQSLLHVAVDAMNFSAVNSLLELGLAKDLVNTPDTFKMTPMHIAAINFDYEIFLLLCKLGPDARLKDKENKTFVDYLKENEDIESEVLSLLNDI